MAQFSNQQYPPGYLEEDISGLILGTASTFLVIETIFMVLLYTSRYVGRRERANGHMDIFLTLTYMVCVGKIITALLMVQIGGTGHHTVTLSPEKRRAALKLSTVSQIICPMTTSLSKLGVLCFFHRIFAQTGRWHRRAIQFTFVLVLCILLVQVLIPFINCRPFKKTWMPETPGKCSIPALALWRFLGLPNVFTTFMVVALPVPAISKLQITRPMKLGFALVLCVCIVGFVAAIMRTRAYIEVTDFHDITYENVKPVCWIITEAGLYLIAGVMLTLRPLLNKVFKDTAIERLINKHSSHSASWSGNKAGPKWYNKTPPAQSSDLKDDKSISSSTMEDVTLARPTEAKRPTADVRSVS